MRAHALFICMLVLGLVHGHMNIIAVDDEPLALNTLKKAIIKADSQAHVFSFDLADDALAHAKSNPVDVAFLDIKMPGMNGITLAKKLKGIQENVNIIFVTGYGDYTMDALDLYASGYVLKPVRANRVNEQLANLRHPVTETKKVRIQCFGSFGVLVNGEPLVFTRNKPKELLAYLVHMKGTALTNAELAAAILEDGAGQISEKTYIRQIVSRLLRVLRDAGIEDIITKGRGSTAIDIEKISCDYYDYLKDREKYAHAFNGEYMNNYSWGEPTLARLTKTK